MSKEGDPHRREREVAHLLGGCRVWMKDRPSKYSRWIDHPWLEVTRLVDTALYHALLALFTRKNKWIETEGKLHIAVIDSRAISPRKIMVIMMLGDFMDCFGGGCDWREHHEKLERERLEREAGPTYELDELNSWTFNR